VSRITMGRVSLRAMSRFHIRVALVWMISPRLVVVCAGWDGCVIGRRRRWLQGVEETVDVFGGYHAFKTVGEISWMVEL